MTTWRPRIIDVAALLGFGLLWLVPLSWASYRGGAPKSWPINVRDAYSVTCLFGVASDRVSMFYVQVRYADRRGWHDLPERDYFHLEPFGHRTRFDRFMARYGHQKGAELARRELAQWLAAAHREREPEQPRIIAMRFVWADRNITIDDPPQARWRKPPRAEAGPIRRLGKIQYIDGGGE